MNYNNYNNPYNQYSYNAYQNNGMQPQQNYGGYQQPQYQNNNGMQQTNHTIFVIVNDYIDVERYIVGANQTVNFYDGKNGYVFSKSADGMGKYTVRAFKLDEIDIKNIGKDNNQNKENREYITRSDLTALQSDFEQKLNNLSSQVEKLSKTSYKNNYNNNKKDSD